MIYDIIENIDGFQWDTGNDTKNWDKHQISNMQCEQVFLNQPLLLFNDEKHSQNEKRYYALGKTNQGEGLFVVFTVRENKLRVISARIMNKNEKAIYEATSNI